MSSYFDAFNAEVSTFSNESDEEFILSLSQAEEKMINDVSLVCGDKRFPDDLREKMMGAIAVWRVDPKEPQRRSNQEALMGRSSVLAGELHSLFHELGSRRIQTPFGLFTDSPKDILTRRDYWIKETY